MDTRIKAVKAVIFNELDEILLLQRNLKKSGQDNWDLPGGIVKPGEDMENTLIREIKEELDVKARITNQGEKWCFFRPQDGQWVNVQNYNCQIEGNISLSEEHIDFRWVKKSDIKNYPVKDVSFYNAI